MEGFKLANTIFQFFYKMLLGYKTGISGYKVDNPLFLRITTQTSLSLELSFDLQYPGILNPYNACP
jgi:hypothetical protein